MSDDAPPVAVTLPEALASLFPGSVRCLELRASTVGEALDGLNARWPGMRDRLCNSTPRIRRNINIFVDGERARLDTRLHPASKMIIMTAVTG